MAPTSDASPEEYDFTLFLRIEEIRMLYDHIDYAIRTWPGSPARPPEEQEYLLKFKTQLFAMLADYNFLNIDMKNNDQ